MRKGYSVSRDFSWIENNELNFNIYTCKWLGTFRKWLFECQLKYYFFKDTQREPISLRKTQIDQKSMNIKRSTSMYRKPIFLVGTNDLNWFFKKIFYCLWCGEFALFFNDWTSFLYWPVLFTIISLNLEFNELKGSALIFQIRLPLTKNY